MGDEDDDYMGDLSKFLPTEPSQPSKPKNPKPSSTQTLTPKTHTRPSKLTRAEKQFQEDQQTLSNLEHAIPHSNIGFKLLQQMGYTPGSALGKEGSGRSEPVGLEIRRSRAGIGREDPLKEKVRKEMEMVEKKRRREEELLVEFGVRQKLQWRSKRVVVNYYKAKGVLDQLENREPEVEDEKGEDGNGEENEEEEEQISEEDLLEILMKLREEHRYCLFCGCQYESMEALAGSCPGINEDDH